MQSAFTYQRRILRETASLLRAGRAEFTHLVGVAVPSLPEHETLDDQRAIWRVRVGAHRHAPPKLRSLAYYAEWYLRIWHRFRREDVRVVHAYSMEALPIAALLKRAKPGSRLLYEPMELETEREWLTGVRKRLWQRVERTFVGDADAVVAVSPAIAAWYQRTYPAIRRVGVIRNIPPRSAQPARSTLLREELRLGAEDVLFIYQGGLSEARGIGFLLDVFRRVGTRHIVFVGYGPSESVVREHAARYGNIHFRDAVPPAELPRYTASADVGIHLLPNTCLNAYYCLPNKVFEFLYAGLPFVVPDYPELGALVSRYGCGWTVPRATDDVVRLVAGLSRDEIGAKAGAARSAREHFSWEEEEKTLLRIYDELALGIVRAPVVT